MADKRLGVSTVQLKGPSGNATTDVRVGVSQVNLHGPLDIRLDVSGVALVAPPPNVRLVVSSLQLVGPASTTKATYVGTPSGWQAVRLSLGNNGQWVQITS